MGIYCVPCAGVKERFVPGIMNVGKAEINVLNDTSPQILSKCPHCGLEMLHVWNYPDFVGEGIVAEKAIEQLHEKHNYEEAEQQITNEIIAFLKNPFCPSCCGKLLFSPGYFYCEISVVFVFRTMERYDKEAVNHFFKNAGFRYSDTDKLTQYMQNNDSNRYDIEPYYFNKLTADFLKGKGIFDRDPPEDLDRGLSILLLAEGDEQISFSRRNYPMSKIPIHWHYLTYEEGFEMLKYYRERMSAGSREEHVDNIINDEAFLAESNLVPVEKEAFGETENLKQYLQNAIQIETDYYALSRRLQELLFVQQEMTWEKNQALYDNSAELGILSESEKALRDAEDSSEKLKAVPDLWKTYYEPNAVLPPTYPKLPERPSQPLLETPGLFNKKKVQAENDAKTAQYKENMAVWEKERDACETERERIKKQYEEAVAKAEQDAKEKASLEIQKAEDAIDAAKSAVTQAKESIARKNALKNQNIGEDIWDKDVRETENLLKQCVDARVQYQNTGIIYPKYQDLVAYSTFYEYLETGRCTVLTGPDGAYNLYETEIRQNMIISQLSTVIDSLEEIKKNQYMVYSQLKKMNDSLDRLNDSMNRAFKSLSKSLSDISGNLSEISNYAKVAAQNSEVIAYNTAATAYYTKMNADLTNALGYLVAFKS